MNMWVLWDVGRLMERLVGLTAMTLIYFLAGIAGGLASLAFHPLIPSVGASGAVFGIIGAMFGLLLHARDAVPPSRMQQLRSGIIAFVIFNLAFGLSVQGIDLAAHVGGAVAGFLAGLVTLPARSPGRWLRVAVLAVAGTGVLWLVVPFLPPPPRDVIAVRKQFPERQREIIEASFELLKEHDLGHLSDQEFAAQFQAKVIAPWRELSAGIADATKDRGDEGRRRKIEQYMRLRQQSFDDLLAAVQKNDAQSYKHALEEAAEAGKIVDDLNRDKG